MSPGMSTWYGDPQVHPQPEDYWGHVAPVGPQDVYDETKRFGEAELANTIIVLRLYAAAGSAVRHANAASIV